VEISRFYEYRVMVGMAVMCVFQPRNATCSS
jgi:hypothetical protein